MYIYIYIYIYIFLKMKVLPLTGTIPCKYDQKFNSYLA